MKQIRNGAFETNSSSTHSISITGSGTIKFPESLRLEFGEFGWEENQYTDPQTKLSYVLTAIQYYDETSVLESVFLDWLKEMLTEAGVKYSSAIGINSEGSPWGYIDHQSTDTLDEIWSDDKKTFKNNMKEFIFNPAWKLQTDNDNH